MSWVSPHSCPAPPGLFTSLLACHPYSRPCLQPAAWTDKGVTARAAAGATNRARVRARARPKSKSCQSQATGQMCLLGRRGYIEGGFLIYFCSSATDSWRGVAPSKRWCTDSKTIEFLINCIPSIQSDVLQTVPHHYMFVSDINQLAKNTKILISFIYKLGKLFGIRSS